MAINWKISKDDMALISKIADRALELLKGDNSYVTVPRQDLVMDLHATHANGNPLKLAELLKADDFQFSHDVFGIRRHLDRETAQLKDFFSPRFSA